MASRSQATRAARALKAGLGLAAIAAIVPVGTAAGAVTQGPGCTASPGAVSCEFWATSGTVPMPNGAGTLNVSVMGYSDTASGAPILPGPSIVATVGDTVTVTLHNGLTAPAEPTGMLFQEQVMAPDLTGVAPGAVGTYTFTASRAGTYLYEASPFVRTSAGGGSQYQTAMGMSGALVVRPDGAPDQAYAAASTAFDAEHVVLTSELDKDLTLANAAGFDMRDYAPEYFLVNGKVAPETADLAAGAGQQVLLRYVNAGIKAHSMSILGQEQAVIGEDGNALDNPRRMVAETFGAGQTDDVIVSLPADADGRYPLYDAGMFMNNNTASGMGGMLTFLDVSGSPADVVPDTTNVRIDGSLLRADVTSASAVEFFVDAVGADGTGTPMAAGPAPGTYIADISGFPGPHTFYVHGQSAGGAWGPVGSVVFANADIAGPLTKGLSLTPNPTNGSAGVLLRATGDDSATGRSDILDGHYTIDGAELTPVELNDLANPNLTPNGSGPVVALDATIPVAVLSGLTEADHTVRVYSKDAAGNWSAPATITLTKDVTGPAASAPTASPSPNNGTNGFSATVRAVRVTVQAADAASLIAAGEGFIDTVGANGTGFPLVPADGTFNASAETLRADIPLSTVAALGPGSHTIHLHGRDAAGNWGAPVSATLVIDKAGPAVSGLAYSPTPTNAGASENVAFTLTGTAADPSGVAAAEWFTGADPGAGNGSPLSVTGNALSTSINFVAQGWAPGNRTISVRARDTLGNWGAPVTVTVAIVAPNTIFRDGFESGSASAWSGITNGGNRISFPGAANMAGTGTVGMQIALTGNTNGANGSAYVTDNSPAAEATYHARFYVDPNGSNPGGGNNGEVILQGYSAANGGGTTRFRLFYRRSGANPQLQYVVGTGNSSTSASSWHTISGGPSYVEVYWKSTNGGTASSLTTSSPAGTFAATASTGQGSIASVRFGMQGLSGNNNSRSGSVRIDAFASTRRTVVGP